MVGEEAAGLFHEGEVEVPLLEEVQVEVVGREDAVLIAVGRGVFKKSKEEESLGKEMGAKSDVKVQT